MIAPLRTNLIGCPRALSPTAAPAPRPCIAAFLALAALLAFAPAALRAQGAPQRLGPAPLLGETPDAGYNEDLLQTRILFAKTDFLVGEPIFWEVEFANSSGVVAEHSFYPIYTGDVYCEVFIKGVAPFRYKGDDLRGFAQRQSNKILPAERRLFPFRIYYDNDDVRPGPSPLLFHEPTQAVVRIVVHYVVNSIEQVYIGEPVVLNVLEPAARNAECLRLLEEGDVIRLIQQERAEREDFEQIEGIINTYPDTVYAPYLAFALANGYFVAARDTKGVDSRMMNAAIKAYRTLQQVSHIPYIKEVSLYQIALCHFYLKDQQAYVAWFDKYLSAYGDRGRFNFAGNRFKQIHEQTKEPDPGEYWYFYP